jgi:hypothetical protein
MTTIQPSARKLILAGGFALAVAAGPAITVLAVPAPDAPAVAQCQEGAMPDASGVCAPAPAINTPAAIPGNPDMPAVDGVPCTGANTGECIGLQESQGGAPNPVP